MTASSTENTEKKDIFAYIGNDENITVVRINDIDKLRPMEKSLRLKNANIRYSLSPGFYSAGDGDGLSGIKISKIDVSTDDLFVTKSSIVPIILDEIKDFFNRKDLFAKFGFSHKRGYLLHGPPGTGKSSLVSLIATEFFKQGGIVLMGEHAWAIKAALQDIRKVNKETPLMVLLEDIDAMVEKGGESELLAILDGQFSVGNTINIATTNYPEKLDNRMTNRPSRFDRRVECDVPNEDTRREYILAKLSLDGTADEIEKWVSATKDMGFSHLKEVIVSTKCFGYNLEDSIKRIKEMKKAPKSKSQDSKVGFGDKDF